MGTSVTAPEGQEALTVAAGRQFISSAGQGEANAAFTSWLGGVCCPSENIKARMINHRWGQPSILRKRKISLTSLVSIEFSRVSDNEIHIISVNLKVQKQLSTSFVL